jgi:hypothetical protein
MAMPIPEQMHEVPRPVSGPRRSSGTTTAAAPRLTPDQEAMQLMMKVVERVEVAKSFAKIAAGLLTVTAARASVELRSAADAKIAETIDREGGLKSGYDRVRKIARAAKDAAVHVATHRPARERESGESDEAAASDPAPETQDAPVSDDVPSTQAAPFAQDIQP